MPAETPSGREALARPVVVLISAAWAGPSRPAPTILRELQRRWGMSVDLVLFEDPDDAVIDELGVEVVPTWLRLEPAPPPPTPDPAGLLDQAWRTGHGDAAGRDEPSHATGSCEQPVPPGLPCRHLALEGASPLGENVTLSGSWVEAHRRTGALPKHVIDQEFGPASHETV